MTQTVWIDRNWRALPHNGRMAPPSPRTRMTATQRREQLIVVGRDIFAADGVQGATVEEIATRAGVTKPVVYEHFGGKEGLYAVVVDRAIQGILAAITDALSRAGGHPRAARAGGPRAAGLHGGLPLVLRGAGAQLALLAR